MDINPKQDLLEFFRDHFGNRTNFSVDDYVHAYGKESVALLYSALFFPELIEIESSVLLKRNIIQQEVARKDILKRKKNISEIESNYNFIEVGYLFEPNGRDISDEEETLLALKIRDGWEGWLKIKYPNRKFIVEVLTPEETGSTIGVHFFESR